MSSNSFPTERIVWYSNMISNVAIGFIVPASTWLLRENIPYMFHIFPHILPDFTQVCDFHGSINDLSYENVDIHITEFDF